MNWHREISWLETILAVDGACGAGLSHRPRGLICRRVNGRGSKGAGRHSLNIPANHAEV